MNFGQLLLGAGTASVGYRQGQEEARVARMQQMKVEEANRLEALRKQMAQTQLPSLQPVQAPQFQFGTLVQPQERAIPIEQVAPKAATPVAPAAPKAGIQVPRETPPPSQSGVPSIALLNPPKAPEVKPRPGEAGAGLIIRTQAPAAPAAPTAGLAMPVEGAAPVMTPPPPVPEDFGLRPDGTPKGTGWLGVLPVAGGGVATEYSMQSDAVKVNGQRVDFPTLVPGLTKAEVDQMVNDIIPNNKDVPEPIVQKAIAHAKTRLSQGQSPFAEATPPPEAPPPPPPAAYEVPATAQRSMEMADFYIANPEAIPFEMQQLQMGAQQQAQMLVQQRNEIAQLAQLMMQSGTSEGIQNAIGLRTELGKLDASLLQLQQQTVEKQMYLTGMQGIRELAAANDPRRLSGVLTAYMGAPVGIQGRSDGTYNLFINGRKVQEGMSSESLANYAQMQFSTEAREAAKAARAAEAEAALKFKYSESVASTLIRAKNDIMSAIINGEYNKAAEIAKANKGDLKFDGMGNSYFQVGNEVFVINPQGKEITSSEGGWFGEDRTVTTGPSMQPVNVFGQ